MFTRKYPQTGVTAVLAGALLLTACTAEPNTSEKQPTTLTLGHTWAADDANAEAIQDFADEVERTSDGDLQIDVYPAGQLGEDAEMLEGLGLETIDMWVGGSGVYSQMSAAGQFLVLPFLFEDLDEAMEVYDGGLGDAVEQQVAEDTNTRLLSLWPRGPRHLTLDSEATVPDDISGLRIRVPENPTVLRTWEQFGASPTPMAFGDVGTALEQGALEGQENPLETIYSAGLASAQSHLILTGHVVEPSALSIGDAAWDQLDDEQRTILQQAANGTVRDDLNDYITAQEEQLEDELSEQGMTVVEPNREAFTESAEGLAELAGSEVVELYERRWDHDQ